MSKQEKCDFISDLIDSVHASLMHAVDKVPEHWDGLELRQLIADKFQEQTTTPMHGRRLREYRNEMLARNI